MVEKQRGHVKQMFSIAATTDVNARDQKENCALIWAAQGGHKEIVQMILAVPDICVNLPNYYGGCLLMCAVFQGHKEIVQMLTAAQDINVNVQTQDGSCALTLAVEEGFFAAHGVNVNVLTQDGDCVLTYAIVKGHWEIAQMLLAAPDISVNTQDEDEDELARIYSCFHEQSIALTLAAFNELGHTERVEALTAACDRQIREIRWNRRKHFAMFL